VSLDVRPGEIVGMFGLVGSGRSDVLNALFGMRRPEGSIRLDGKPVTIASPSDAIRSGIAFVTENRKEEGLVLPHAVDRNINMVALRQLAGAAGFMRPAEERTGAQAEVKRLSIKTNSLDTIAGTLSGGNQQKIVIAREMRGREYSVLLASQPTRGVDVGAIEFIHEQLRAARASGKGVLLVSADLIEVLSLADRVAVMYEGKIVATLSRAEATPELVGEYMTGATRTGEHRAGGAR